MNSRQMIACQRRYSLLVGAALFILGATILGFVGGSAANIRQSVVDAEEKAYFEAARAAAKKKVLEERNARWEECKADGDRPVMAGLQTVVCIKQDAIAWEAALPPGAP